MQLSTEQRVSIARGVLQGGVTLAGMALGQGPLAGIIGGAVGMLAQTSGLDEAIVSLTVEKVQEAGSELIGKYLEKSTEQWFNNWSTERGALNPDIAAALTAAFTDAVSRLERDWQPFYRSIKQQNAEVAELTLEPFRHLAGDAESLFVGETTLLGDADARLLLAEDEAGVRKVLQDKLRNYLLGHDHRLVQFIEQRLPDTWLLRFGEILQKDDEQGARAWRACQRLWLSSMESGIRQLQTDSAETVNMTRWLYDWAQRLDRLPPSERDPQGLAAIETALNPVRERLDRLYAVSTQILTNTDEIKTGVGELQAQLDLLRTELRTQAARPSGTVTFLFINSEPQAALPALLQSIIATHEGYIFTLESADRLLRCYAAFHNATNAVNAAIALRQSLQPAAGGAATPLRMAVHTGATTERDGGYFGPPIHRTTCLVEAGHSGEILVSAVTQELVRDTLPEGMRLRDLGELHLKDLLRPEHIYRLAGDDEPESPPPLSLDMLPNNLPVQLTGFIGRETEMAEVKQMLATTRLLTLLAMGGAGKTRLAIQVAADLLESFKDGVWLVELAPLSDPELVPHAIASEFSVEEQPGKSLTATLTEYLRDKQMLLVLDNCEHMIEACAGIVNTLLRRCPKLKILATSRIALNIAGEMRYRVPSLPVPDPNRLPPLDRLDRYAGIRLFVERAVAVQSSFTLNEKNAAAVASICYHLDGIPLAIELAAARARALPAEEIAVRLNDRFRLLTGGSRTALRRQQTLRALIDWSYELLTEQERLVMQRLAAFAGGWTLEAAEVVCAGDDVEDFEVLDLLTQLVDQSMVVLEEGEQLRYRMLETIRQYAIEKFRASGEEDATRRRHLAYYLELAEQAEPLLQGAEQAEWLERMETDHDNMRAALDFAQESGEDETGLRLVNALGYFWRVRCHLSEGRSRLEAALSTTGSTDQALRANALYRTGNLAKAQGDYVQAIAAAEESLALFRTIGDTRGESNALNTLAEIAYERRNFSQAMDLLDQILTLRREQGNKQLISQTLNNMGIIALGQGNHERALPLLEESLTLRQELNDTRGIADTLMNLGGIAFEQGNYDRASKLYEESLTIYRAIDERLRIALLLGNLVEVAEQKANYAQAVALLEESLNIYRNLDSKRDIAYTLAYFGRVSEAQGDALRATELYQQSLKLYQELGDKRGCAEVQDYLAALQSHAG